MDSLVESVSNSEPSFDPEPRSKCPANSKFWKIILWTVTDSPTARAIASHFPGFVAGRQVKQRAELWYFRIPNQYQDEGHLITLVERFVRAQMSASLIAGQDLTHPSQVSRSKHNP